MGVRSFVRSCARSFTFECLLVRSPRAFEGSGVLSSVHNSSWSLLLTAFGLGPVPRLGWPCRAVLLDRPLRRCPVPRLRSLRALKRWGVKGVTWVPLRRCPVPPLHLNNMRGRTRVTGPSVEGPCHACAVERRLARGICWRGSPCRPCVPLSGDGLRVLLATSLRGPVLRVSLEA